jgi:hypothetical protein
MEVDVPNDNDSPISNDSNSNDVSGLSYDVIDSDDPLISGASITIPRFPSFQEKKRYAKKMPRLEYGSFLKCTQIKHCGTWHIAKFVRETSTTR